VDRRFSKEKVEVANKSMKKFSTPWPSGKCKSELHRDSILPQSEQVGEDEEKKEPFYTVLLECKLVQPLGK
jgi:hypothetical protein